MSDDPLRLRSTATWSGETEDGPRPIVPVEGLEAAIGTRYVLAEELGRGGMAVVRAAYDRQLARRVAVKLLRPDQRGNAGSARLVREAQALAQLRHPNVVTVFDAGQHEGQMFLAMELVEGESLRKWMSAARRPWRDIVNMFIGAGRGLVAAHAAGLVHRDFKPDNVLLGGDGTPRVADFGLARFVASAGDAPVASEAPTQHAVALDRTVTRAGAVVGTPPYLAPEVMLGETADARSDQFSFGVSLAEALAGERPYRGHTLDELLHAIEHDRPRLDGVSPAWIRAVVERTIAREPGLRFPSMDAVIHALGRDPARRRRRILLAGGGVVLAGAAVAGAVMLGRSEGAAPPPSCDAVSSLDGVWDGPRRAALDRAFAASQLTYAPAIGHDLARSLDAYADAIHEGERTLCEARRRGEADAAVRLRTACLDRRRAELGAMVDAALVVDDKAMPRMSRAMSRMSLVVDCANVEALRRVAVSQADRQGTVTSQTLLAAVDRARIISHIGRPADAVAMLEPLVPQAKALGHPPTEAELLLALGNAVEALDQVPAAEVHMRGALILAQASHHDEVVARAAASLALNIGRLQKRAAEGRTWAELAIATSARLGKPAQLEAYVHFAAAVVAIGDHRADDAEREAMIALEAGKGGGYDDVQVAEVINTLGGVALDRGRFEEAGARYREARDLSAPHLGEDHPGMIVYDSNLASVATALGEYPRAVELRRRVLDARRRTIGPTAPRVGEAYMVLAQSMAAAGQFADAVPEARQAVKILGAAGFDTPPSLAARLTLAEVLGGAGQPDEAVTIATTVEHAAATAGDAALAMRLDALALLGEVAFNRGKPAAAAPFFAQIVTIATAGGGAHSGALGRALLGQARLARAAGKRTDAADLARRARERLLVTHGPSSQEARAAAEELRLAEEPAP